MRRGVRGMTLVELMIVVVIVGVLSVLAVTGFRRYTLSARNTEAQNFLGTVRAAQEAYYQSFGQYCGAVAEARWPANIPFENKVPWGQPPAGNGWADLGIKSPGQVWFQYVLRAGRADQPAGPAFQVQPETHWFQASAHGDFNGDNIQSTFEVTSKTTTVYVLRENE